MVRYPTDGKQRSDDHHSVNDDRLAAPEIGLDGASEAAGTDWETGKDLHPSVDRSDDARVADRENEERKDEIQAEIVDPVGHPRLSAVPEGVGQALSVDDHCCHAGDRYTV